MTWKNTGWFSFFCKSSWGEPHFSVVVLFEDDGRAGKALVKAGRTGSQRWLPYLGRIHFVHTWDEKWTKWSLVSMTGWKKDPYVLSIWSLAFLTIAWFRWLVWLKCLSCCSRGQWRSSYKICVYKWVLFSTTLGRQHITIL